MAAAKFKFIEVYRRIAPAAGREIVAARQKGHDKLYPLLEQTMERVYDVCRLAFLFPQSSIPVVEWFEKTLSRNSIPSSRSSTIRRRPAASRRCCFAI